jgi:uncharacterized membrane protein YfcA
MDWIGYVAATGAASAGGVMNAVVGGGTLVTFPTLLALGVPPVAASVTNTVALTPGYLSGAVAQRAELTGQRERMMRLVGISALGGLAGAGLLLVTSDDALRNLVPVLLGLATLLLALANRIRRAVGRADVADDAELADARWLPAVIGLVAVYGGFFGAGVGVMLLAVLSIGVHQPLNRSNAIKQAMSLVINVTAASFFVFSGKVYWGLAAVMSVGSIAGGHVGGRFVGRLDPQRFRLIVVVIGAVLTVVYAVRTWF